MRVAPADAQAYFGKVGRLKDEYCWTWHGGVRKDGYAVIRIEVDGVRRPAFAHKVGWILNGGSSHDRILNTCGHRSCQNMRHWQKIADSKDARETRSQAALKHNLRGEAHPNAILTEARVRSIKRKIANNQSLTSIAREEKIHISTVSSIKQGYRWAHIS